MNKKIAAIITVIFILSLMIIPSNLTANEDITVEVNGEKVIFDTEPFIENGRTLVPVRGIFEELGANVEWNEKESKVTISKYGLDIILVINSNIALIYDNNNSTSSVEELILEVPAKIYEQRTYIPVRFVSEALGAKVDWDAETTTVIIKEADVLTEKYKELSYEDIKEDDELEQWYQSNRQKEGINYIKKDNVYYVLIGAGERSTGGYSVEIEDVLVMGTDGVYITARVISPQPGAMVTQAITYPHRIISIDKSNVEGIGEGFYVDGVVLEGISKKSSNDGVVQITPDMVKTIEIYNLSKKKIKEYDEEEIIKIITSLNESTTDDSPYIMLLTGKIMKVTFNDSTGITITSYGSETNIVTSGYVGNESYNYHLVCPEIAKMLIE